MKKIIHQKTRVGVLNSQLFLFLLLFVITSCSQEIFFKQEDEQSQIVVNSLINPDSVFTCYITKTVSPLTQNIPYVDNATVKIVNDVTDELIAELFHKQKGWYKTEKVKPKAGINYRLEVDINGRKKITANTTIPSKSKAAKFVMQYNAVYDKTMANPTEEDLIHTLSFSVLDNGEESNFYEVDVYYGLSLYASFINNNNQLCIIGLDSLQKQFTNTTFEGHTESIKVRLDTLLSYSNTFSFYCLDAAVNAENITEPHMSPASLIFSNSTFKGQEKQISTDLQSGFGSYGYGMKIRGDYLFTLRSLSPELFAYLQSVRKQQQEINEKDFNPFDGSFVVANGEIDIESNVKNAYGVFAGYNVQNYIIHSADDKQWWHKYVVE